MACRKAFGTLKGEMMDLREALIAQSPSLALQREAQSEIARLDDLVQRMAGELAAADLARRIQGQTLHDAAQAAGLKPGDSISEKLVPAIVALKRGAKA